MYMLKYKIIQRQKLNIPVSFKDLRTTMIFCIKIYLPFFIVILAGDGSTKIRGCWDSIHVVEVQVIILQY